ncbi:SDR family oxidoreductase [Chitinophaga pendula]|uniref:SDR family oxidoreductase n=1 Tax=Chitinophaga TaxID=79328 RepID=UPI000BAF1F5B|nr:MULTISPECIES: SDR family oxidoreductase [Chitinophaga]ASZ10174.1 sugar dehydrogenase [Chitinophaga sp. MD30]UCJ06871.1 SDR family oxidoreductase [Chitinophaga pendula]
MDKPLHGQVAIVTGSSAGIGASVAEKLALAGATVVINYNSDKSYAGADAVLGRIRIAGGEGILYQCDVSKEEDVKKFFADIIAQFGTFDILVSNAGIQQDAPFIEMTLEQWDRVIAVNLTGQFLCCREAAREFIRRGVIKERSIAAGKIICMSSVHEVIPWAGHVNYAASKGGVKLLMQSIAQELAPHRIRVNGIAPGAIKTRINADAWDTPEDEAKLLELIPYGRVGDVSDVAKAAVWLASDDSDYVTGTTLFVDGGMTLYPGFADNG